MALIRYRGYPEFRNPFQELSKLRSEMDRLFADVMGGTPFTATSGVYPALNVTEDADKLYVRAELPGIKAEDIDISVEGTTLTLRGERKPDSTANVSYHRRERKAGRFHKALTLPYEISHEGVVAECRNGVLKLTLPKSEQAKPKKIAVKSE